MNNSIHNITIPPYSDLYLNRANNDDLNQHYLDELYYSDTAEFVIIMEDNIWLTTDNQQSPLHVLTRALKNTLKSQTQHIYFLGFLQHESFKQPIFAINGSADQANVITDSFANGSTENIRKLAKIVDKKTIAILGYAKSMVSWHSNNCFCGKCGGSTEILLGGKSRKCIATECRQEHYPRIDPAVITLVEYIPEDGSSPMCLLGRGNNSDPNRFSTFAGFMEMGETFEQAVKREVFEEVGLIVDDIQYQGAQPWPFPNSIMVGFRSRAKSLDFKVDGNEIVEAKWFRVDEITPRGNWCHDASNIDNGINHHDSQQYDSISRLLIENWIAENLGKIRS